MPRGLQREPAFLQSGAWPAQAPCHCHFFKSATRTAYSRPRSVLPRVTGSSASSLGRSPIVPFLWCAPPPWPWPPRPTNLPSSARRLNWAVLFLSARAFGVAGEVRAAMAARASRLFEARSECGAALAHHSCARCALLVFMFFIIKNNNFCFANQILDYNAAIAPPPPRRLPSAPPPPPSIVDRRPPTADRRSPTAERRVESSRWLTTARRSPHRPAL